MKEVTQAIDAHYAAIYPDFKYWGLAELTDKSKDRSPVTVNGREKVCLDEDFNACVWYREISVNRTEVEEESFGLDVTFEYRVTLRTIIGYKIELGEMFKYEFAEAFPRDFTLSGFEALEVVPGVMDLDRERVAQTEEVHIQYEKLLCWNLLSFDNELQFILCPETSP